MPTAFAVTLNPNTEIQPNSSSSGYYNITDSSYCKNLTVNSTHAVFMYDSYYAVINTTSGLNITPHGYVNTITQTDSIEHINLTNISGSSISVSHNDNIPKQDGSFVITVQYNSSDGTSIGENCSLYLKGSTYYLDYASGTHTKTVSCDGWSVHDYDFSVSCANPHYDNQTSSGNFTVIGAEGGGYVSPGGYMTTTTTSITTTTLGIPTRPSGVIINIHSLDILNITDEFIEFRFLFDTNGQYLEIFLEYTVKNKESGFTHLLFNEQKVLSKTEIIKRLDFDFPPEKDNTYILSVKAVYIRTSDIWMEATKDFYYSYPATFEQMNEQFRKSSRLMLRGFFAQVILETPWFDLTWGILIPLIIAIIAVLIALFKSKLIGLMLFIFGVMLFMFYYFV
jgi:hypothetical protein